MYLFECSVPLMGYIDSKLQISGSLVYILRFEFSERIAIDLIDLMSFCLIDY